MLLICIPDPSAPVLLLRAWCLFEIAVAVYHGVRARAVCRPGVYLNNAVYAWMSVENAKCSDPPTLDLIVVLLDGMFPEGLDDANEGINRAIAIACSGN